MSCFIPLPTCYFKRDIVIIKVSLQDKFTIANGSILSFTPTSEDDFGTISCKATNAGGQQTEPCRYNLIAATRPDPPHNCSSHNMTDDSIEVRCKAGKILNKIILKSREPVVAPRCDGPISSGLTLSRHCLHVPETPPIAEWRRIA